MSGVTKRQLEAQNAELVTMNRQLEKMSSETIALSRGLRADVDEIEMAAGFFKQQRDRLIGYIEGTRTDRDRNLASGGVVMSPQDQTPARTRIDQFLDENRQEPPIRDGVRRL